MIIISLWLRINLNVVGKCGFIPFILLVSITFTSFIITCTFHFISFLFYFFFASFFTFSFVLLSSFRNKFPLQWQSSVKIPTFIFVFFILHKMTKSEYVYECKSISKLLDFTGGNSLFDNLLIYCNYRV